MTATKAVKATKGKKLQIRISEEERREWNEKARKAGMTLAQWVYEKCAGPDPAKRFYRRKRETPVEPKMHLCSHCNGNGIENRSDNGQVVLLGTCPVCNGQGAVPETVP